MRDLRPAPAISDGNVMRPLWQAERQAGHAGPATEVMHPPWCLRRCALSREHRSQAHRVETTWAVMAVHLQQGYNASEPDLIISLGPRRDFLGSPGVAAMSPEEATAAARLLLNLSSRAGAHLTDQAPWPANPG